MSEIRKLEKEDFPAYAKIVANAYPGIGTLSPELLDRYVQYFTRITEEEDTIDFYGYFKNGKLVGGMRIHHFMMNLYSRMIPAGGVGQVAVDLLHKKEKIAKHLIEYFIRYFKQKGVPLILLYPFRPDFYKKMGFGYGTNMNSYEITPSSFPAGKSKEHLEYIAAEDKEALLACYNRYAETTHGMMLKTLSDVEMIFRNPENITVGYKEGNEIKGYIVFSFKKKSETNFTVNNLVIKEMIYGSPEVLEEICAFLNSQSDQVNRVVWTTPDDSIRYLIHDPRNETRNLIPSVYHESHISGVGLMYRVIDAKEMFFDLWHRNFNGITCNLKVTVQDTMLPENSQSIDLEVNNGALKIVEEGKADVEISLDISDLSSLLMGSADFNSLYRLGRVKISDPSFTRILNKMFLAEEKPVCLTPF